MLRKISRKYLSNIVFYSKKIWNQLKLFVEYPIYYTKEILSIVNSLCSSIILYHSNLKRIIRKINGVKFLFDFSYNPKFRTMYFGMVQTHVIKVFLKYIKKESVFIDVGANVGHFSAIGAGLVGKSGQVHSFEPVPEYFNKLSEISILNKQYQIYVNNFALGETSGTLEMNLTKSSTLGWSTLVPDFMKSDEIKKTFKVNVMRLDDYIFEKKIKNISLIKIDVEGFEFPVLKGLSKFFKENKEDLPPIIVEVVPVAYSKLGYKIEDLENYMRNFSYYAFWPNGKSRADLKKLEHWRDILFIQINKKSKY